MTIHQKQTFICNLSGALTLPLVSNLLANASDIQEVSRQFHQLNTLYNNHCYILAFERICTLFETAKLSLPQLFYEAVVTDSDKRNFVGEFLTDLQDILRELS